MNMIDPFARLEQPLERTTVVVSRFWNNPQISVTVNRDKIVIEAQMADFVEALVTEVYGKKRRLVLAKRKKLEQELRDAVAEAIEKVKMATSQVM